MQYEGSVYIAVAGGEDGNEICRDSIHNIIRRPGDDGPVFGRGTKGYEVRQRHLDFWYNQTEHQFILMLDRDMVFPGDTLERLRAHGLPFVSGFYCRRHIEPVAPVWLRPFTGEWPLEPFLDEIDPGSLYELGASGWGCILMHRDVVRDTKSLLKGEPEIIEDDMDLWPYDSAAILRSLRLLRNAAENSDDDCLFLHLEALEKEIKPLRVDKKTCIGSDIRFAWFAKQAGYPLYGDSGVNCGHNINYPLSLTDWRGTPADLRIQIREGTHKNVMTERDQLRQLYREVTGG